jgi:hypothetical protein
MVEAGSRPLLARRPAPPATSVRPGARGGGGGGGGGHLAKSPNPIIIGTTPDNSDGEGRGCCRAPHLDLGAPPTSVKKPPAAFSGFSKLNAAMNLSRQPDPKPGGPKPGDSGSTAA